MRSDNFCERYTDDFHNKCNSCTGRSHKLWPNVWEKCDHSTLQRKLQLLHKMSQILTTKNCGHCRCEMWSQHFATPLVASTKRFPTVAVLLQNHRLQNYASLTLKKNKNINVNSNLSININSKQFAQIVWHHNWYCSHVLDINYFTFQFNSQLARFWQGREELRSF